ncbi:MAG: hypothetical protein QOH56_854 [Pseudonocardiales bacterium]|jgi:hypothetical protein|nr:hypothetical protein [Pseudonocardiales bacterium]
MATTPNALPYPLPSSAPNMPADMQALAVALDHKVIGSFATAAARTAAITAPNVGDLTYRADAAAYESWNGAAWSLLLTSSVIRFRGMLAASTSVTGAANIAFTATEDNVSGWNATNKNWTVPTGFAGLYLFSIQCRCGGTAAVPIAELVINGSVVYIGSQPPSAAAATSTLVNTRALANGDTVSAQSLNAYVATVSGNDNWLSITRLGPS